jgi:hypothetical protein
VAEKGGAGEVGSRGHVEMKVEEDVLVIVNGLSLEMQAIFCTDPGSEQQPVRERISIKSDNRLQINRRQPTGQLSSGYSCIQTLIFF